MALPVVMLCYQFFRDLKKNLMQNLVRQVHSLIHWSLIYNT